MTLGFPVPIHKSIQTDLVLHGNPTSVADECHSTYRWLPSDHDSSPGSAPFFGESINRVHIALQTGGFKRAILQRARYFRYHVETKLCERTRGGWVGVTYVAGGSWSEGRKSPERRRSEYRDDILIRARNIVNSRTRCELKIIEE